LHWHSHLRDLPPHGIWGQRGLARTACLRLQSVLNKPREARDLGGQREDALVDTRKAHYSQAAAVLLTGDILAALNSPQPRKTSRREQTGAHHCPLQAHWHRRRCSRTRDTACTHPESPRRGRSASPPPLPARLPGPSTTHGLRHSRARHRLPRQAPAL
jgi:hypothetical protein